MKLHHLNNRGVHGYTTFGSVWDRGEAHTSHFTLMDVNQKRIPVQSKVTAYWPDGSIKWAAHTADAVLMGEECELLTTGEYAAKMGEEKAETVITGATGSKITGNEADEEDIMPRIAVTKTQNGAVVDTGILRVEIPGLFARETTGVNALVDEIRLDGKKRCGEIFPVMYLEHPAPANECMEEWMRKTFCRGEIESVELEEQGSLQCVI
ncbi:MAG: hypothetical protein LUH07_13895, partial [Lachnospiraceae bacterium]|nr:hypothetical protein [Lachnospiraceae bacterium]